MNPPILPPHPPDHGNVVRIMLSQAASRHLTATGEQAFAIIHKIMRGVEEPGTGGRWAITLIPCSIPEANAAVRVARGIAKESKIKTKQ